MHTDPVDENGTDLPAVINSLCDPEIHKVKFVLDRLDDNGMNYLYSP